MEGIITIVGLWIKHWISVLGYSGVAAMMAIESACIPLPSEIIMPFAGSLVVGGTFNLHLASLAGAFGCAVGSTVAYYAGMLGGRPFLEKYGKYFLVRKKDIDIADYWFGKYGEPVVFFSRLLPVVRTFISFPAGVSRMHFGRFVMYSFIGSVPWCYFLTYIGVKVGQNLKVLQPYFHKADAIIGVIIIGGIAFFLYHHLKPEND